MIEIHTAPGMMTQSSKPNTWFFRNARVISRAVVIVSTMMMAKINPMRKPRDWDTGEPGGRTNGFGTLCEPKSPKSMSSSLEFSGGWPK